MKIYTVTTMVDDTYPGSSAYSEPFLTEEDMNEYYESEIEYMKNEYEISEDNIKKFMPGELPYESIFKKTEMREDGINIEITVGVKNL